MYMYSGGGVRRGATRRGAACGTGVGAPYQQPISLRETSSTRIVQGLVIVGGFTPYKYDLGGGALFGEVPTLTNMRLTSVWAKNESVTVVAKLTVA